MMRYGMRRLLSRRVFASQTMSDLFIASLYRKPGTVPAFLPISFQAGPYAIG
jgi:hypothetical protein